MPESEKKGRRASRTEIGPAGASRPSTVLVAFRVPVALAERLDELAAELSTPWHEVKRSELARTAVERGLHALEQETAKRRAGE
jgi:predicted transcriptional regulator